MLEVSIKKRLPGFSLDVSFESAGCGKPLALLGASGCGKSVTLQCIAGLIRPDEGQVVLNGRTLFDSAKGVNLSPGERKIGFLFQHYSLFPNMTALQNIMCAIDAPRHIKRERALALMESLRLEGCEKKRPHQLSGGQRQRCALARMLAQEPEAMLLDEPFSALDGYLRWRLELLLLDTLREFGGPSVLVSHSRDEVYRLSSAVCVLNAGKSEPAREVHELFSAPETMDACLITGCKNYSLAVPAADGRVFASDWGVALRVDAPLPEGLRYVGVRAHYVRPGTGENSLSCRVDRVIDDVFGVIIMLITPGGREGRSLLRAEMSTAEWLGLGAPDSLDVHISPGDIMPLR